MIQQPLSRSTLHRRTLCLLLALTLWSFPTMYAQERENPLRDSLRRAAEVLAHHPDSADLRLRKAAFNLQLGEWTYAKSEYDLILRHQPNNIAALFYRAYVNEKLHRYNFARADYQRMLRIVPGHFEGQLGLALLNQKDKHHTEAMDALNRLVSTFPDSATAWAARAGVETERGLIVAAEYDYSEALRRTPDNDDYRLNRAELRIRLGKYKEAKDDLDRIVRNGTPRMALKEWYERCK